MRALFVGELAHLYRAGALKITGGLVIVSMAVWWLLPNNVSGPFSPNALLTPAGFHAMGPMAYSNILEVVIPWATAALALILQREIGEGARALSYTWPVPTFWWMMARVAALLAWGVGWTLVGAGIPAMLGAPIAFGRVLASVFPVVLMLIGITLAASECGRDAWAGVAALGALSLLGLGIRGLPFQQAIKRNLEIFDARNHLWTGGLIHNLLWLVALGLFCLAVGEAAWNFHRKRGEA